MAEPEIADLLAAADMTEVGHRIRLARVTKGLTQTQLAGGEVSVGYVSRIESGQRRPDPGLLLRMAERLRVSPLVLLSGAPDPVFTGLQLALDHAELCLYAGRPAEAEQQLTAIWSEIDGSETPDLEFRARVTRARALEQMGRLDEAIIETEDLLARLPEDGSQAIRAAKLLTFLYIESGDLARAIDVGERHLSTLRRLELEGSDEAVQLVVTLAGAYFTRGDLGHGIRMCQRAVEQAEKLDTPLAKGSAYWNASVMEARRGAVESAVALGAKALQLFEAADDSRNLARLRTTLGAMQLQLDPPPLKEARAHLEAAREQLRWSRGSVADLADNAVAIARADLLSGDLQGAEERASAALDQVRGVSPLLCVEALMVLGQAAATTGDADRAARHYREAVLQLTGVGSDRGAAEAWFELGTMLDELGLEREAHDAYRSAAASTGLRSLYGGKRMSALR